MKEKPFFNCNNKMEHSDSNRSDEQITALVQTGRTDLFGVLVLRYEKSIWRYGRKFISDCDDIEDAVQDIFIKAYKNIQSFDAKRKFSTWLYRIAHNQFVNILKKKKFSPLSLFEFDTFLPQKLIKDDLQQKVIEKEMRELMGKCIDELDAKYKEPLVLHYFEDLNYREISEIMQIPVSTVGVRLKRGRELLSSIWKNHDRK